MAAKRKKALKEMTNDELAKLLDELESEVKRERSTKAREGRPSNAGRFRESRKLVARIKTLLSMRGVKV